jgi:hypothetical protein
MENLHGQKDCRHYLEKHNVRLPEEFIGHIKRRNFNPRKDTQPFFMELMAREQNIFRRLWNVLRVIGSSCFFLSVYKYDYEIDYSWWKKQGEERHERSIERK